MIERAGIPKAAEILARYPSKRSAMMPLLYEVQERDGYVTEAGMEEVAEHIGLTPAEVLGVCSLLLHVQADDRKGSCSSRCAPRFRAWSTAVRSSTPI